MFNVKVDTIRERTTNGPTYMKGRQYYRQGQVRHLTYDQEKGIILAQVEGTRTYSVRIILNGKGELHDATCTCSAFAAYWGLCRHIAATLLYCVDAFGQQKTHILSAESTASRTDSAAKSPDPAAAAAGGANAGIMANAAGGNTGPLSDTGDSIVRQQLSARQQAQRRSRSKTRDFLARMDHVARLTEVTGKRPVRLQVTLYCSPASCALPWLSFAIGENQLYPVSNVEQFAEAISRDLPLELDKDFILNPLQHAFLPQDQPLVAMLQDAFENDYKAVFGTSHASSRDRFFTLNASRFASVLIMAGTLSDCGWQFLNDTGRQAVRIRQAQLPISLHLTCEAGPEEPCVRAYRLELRCDQSLQQMTASRNIYLVGDVFYLPPHDSLRLIEPILSTFNTPGLRQLTLNRDEVMYLISDIRQKLQPVCPVILDSRLAARVIDTPLQPAVELDYGDTGLRAAVAFRYGSLVINPLTPPQPETGDDSEYLVVRDRFREDELLQLLIHSGFVRQGLTYRLSDSDDLYVFLTDTVTRLSGLAEVRMSAAARRLRVLPPPDIKLHLQLSDNQDALVLRQDFPGFPEAERQAYLQALREKRPFLRLADGSFLQVRQSYRDVLLQLTDLLQLWGITPGSAVGSLPRYRALALENLLAGATACELLNADEEVRDMIRQLREPGSLSFRLPSSLRGKLRPYQRTGFQWLCTLDYYGLGGILADDMGLGKTLQTIAYVSQVWQQRKKPSLIIAPTSLVYNWQSEFEKFAPRLPVLVLDGNRQQRAIRLGDISGHACLITSYSLLRRDIDEISAFSFASCFLDEAQNIKNPETLNARSVKQVRADRCFALTGTPIENSLTELWSIFDFILPGYLYSQKTFQAVYELPIVREGNKKVLDSLHQQIVPFILRRMKKDVLRELPDKIETRTICDMTDEQRQTYDSFLHRSRTDMEKEVSRNGYARSQIFILALLTRLRQICCHPALFIKDFQGDSGKMQLLEELLADSFSAGHRVLVFSQFTSMLELIRKSQLAQGRIPFLIDGQVPAEERLLQVQRFNQGEGQLFLVSLRAGGTGLNLTGADTVIHFDPWWNPAVEEQATDRAYRIGQENVVQVFKLYTRHSIEEKIYHLQRKKQNLIDSIITPGQNFLSKMTIEEVRSLFET
ncbi:MAG TPA: helicase [Clostridiales bacterium]|nr:helicase [Clostridiales bacterium]